MSATQEEINGASKVSSYSGVELAAIRRIYRTIKRDSAIPTLTCTGCQRVNYAYATREDDFIEFYKTGCEQCNSIFSLVGTNRKREKGDNIID